MPRCMAGLCCKRCGGHQSINGYGKQCVMKRVLLALALLSTLALGPSEAQNTTCSDRPAGDSSNACANTRFVMTNGGGGGTPGGLNLQVQYNNAGAFGGLTDAQLTGKIIAFTSVLSGAAPASGGGIFNFLRADGTWAPPGSGSTIVGTIIPWAGATVPPKYLLAYGQAVSRATYPDLLTVITFQPSITCTSGSPTFTVATATSDRVPIGAAVEASACFTAGKTVISKASGSLTLSGNAIASTTTTARILPWGGGDGSTTFNLPNLQGRAPLGRDNMSGAISSTITLPFYGTNPDAINASGGGQGITLQQANLPAITLSTNIFDSGHQHQVTGAMSNAGNSGILGAFVSAIGSNGSGVGLGTTTTNQSGITANTPLGGGNAPFTTIQPSVTVDYIIKVLADDISVGGGITVGSTVVNNGSTTNILYNNAGILGEYALATVPDMYAGTANNKIVTPSVVWPPEVTVTYGTTTTFDMSTFRDAVVTLTGNITTQTVSNVVVGKAGSIAFVQDGTGSRTTVWSSTFKFAGGTAPTLTTTAGAVDILNYSCRTSTFCYAAMMNDVK